MRVRRERPGAARAGIALMLAMLMLYLLTRQAGRGGELRTQAAPAAGERVTREITFGALGGYFARMGVSEDPGDARVAAARHTPRGAAGYVRREGGAYDILGAGYETAGEAARAVESLREQGVAADVTEAAAPAVTLKITAAPEEIAAVVAAEALLRDAFCRLSGIAASLDAGEADTNRAMALVSVLRYEARRAGDALSAVRGWADSAACRGLSDKIGRLCGDLDDLCGQNAGARLFFSSRIKYNGIDARLGHIAWLSALADEAAADTQTR